MCITRLEHEGVPTHILRLKMYNKHIHTDILTSTSTCIQVYMYVVLITFLYVCLYVCVFVCMYFVKNLLRAPFIHI